MITVGCKIDEIRIDGNLHNLRTDLERYAALGMEGVEIPVHGVDAIKNGELNRKRLAEVREILKSFDFQYSVHSPNPLNLMDTGDPQKHLAVFRSSLEFAAAIGSRILVYHAGRFIPEETFGLPVGPVRNTEREGKLWTIERSLLRQMAQEFPGIIIGVENARPYLYHSPYCYGERLEFLKRMIQEVEMPNVRITLDIGHLNMAARFYNFDLALAVAEVSGQIAHIHIHDNFGGTIYYIEKIQTHQIPFGRGDAHMPVGWGNIPFSSLLSEILPSYSGLLIMELRSRYIGDLKESKTNLMQMLNRPAFAADRGPEAAFGAYHLKA
jgi:sugar phosphate isomerase/epimerase